MVELTHCPYCGLELIKIKNSKDKFCKNHGIVEYDEYEYNNKKSGYIG
jgi:hypothetical protein